MKRKVAILGGGITGLSAAYYLKDRADVTLFEEAPRVGGWIQSTVRDGFFFESGPRSLRGNDAKEALELIEELGLTKDLVMASPSANSRYILKEDQLVKVPSGVIEFVTSSLTRPYLLTLLKDLIPRKSSASDESVEQFFSRRFSRSFAEQFIDPLVKGIYGAEMGNLSMQGAFPYLYAYEKQYGSLLLGTLFSSKQKKTPIPGIVTLQRGLSSLTEALANQLEGQIQLNAPVKALHFQNDRVQVTTSKGTEIFNHVISTLPAPLLSNLLPSNELQNHLSNFPSTSLHIVHLGFKQDKSLPTGFGYLVPSLEKSQVLGVIFDSEVFPTQNSSPDQVRLTVMLASSCQDPLQEAIAHVQKVLSLTNPVMVHTYTAKNAIPCYPVGYPEWKAKAHSLSPNNLSLLGTSFHGVSLNSCIKAGREGLRTKDEGIRELEERQKRSR